MHRVYFVSPLGHEGNIIESCLGAAFLVEGDWVVLTEVQSFMDADGATHEVGGAYNLRIPIRNIAAIEEWFDVVDREQP